VTGKSSLLLRSFWVLLVGIPFLLIALVLRVNFGFAPTALYGFLWILQIASFGLLAVGLSGSKQICPREPKDRLAIYISMGLWGLVSAAGCSYSLLIFSEYSNPIYPLGDMNYVLSIAFEILALFTMLILERGFQKFETRLRALCVFIVAILGFWLMEWVLAYFRMPTMAPEVPESLYFRIFAITALPILVFSSWVSSNTQFTLRGQSKFAMWIQFTLAGAGLALLIAVSGFCFETLLKISGLIALFILGLSIAASVKVMAILRPKPD
jgi:hypothetical protein